MSMEWWYWAAMQATICLRLRALGKKIASGAPTFGDQVLIRDATMEKKSFEANGKDAMFLCWSPLVSHGAWVVCAEEGRENQASKSPR